MSAIVDFLLLQPPWVVVLVLILEPLIVLAIAYVIRELYRTVSRKLRERHKGQSLPQKLAPLH